MFCMILLPAISYLSPVYPRFFVRNADHKLSPMLTGLTVAKCPYLAETAKIFSYSLPPIQMKRRNGLRMLFVNKIPQKFAFDPSTQIQGLNAYVSSPVGVDALNTRLQGRLNPPSSHKPEHLLFGQIMRVGDTRYANPE